MLIRILIFYCLALLSNILRKELFGLRELINDLPLWLGMSVRNLQSIGIFAGGLVALHLMKKKKNTQYSFFGSSKGYSLLIAAVPLILITAFGLNNTSGMNQHLFGFMAASGVLVYCYFEEIGWRGYLHDELQSLKQWQRVLIIGFLWWFWHLQFIGDYNIISNLKFLLILTASAFGLGILIERTKSVLTVTAFHMVVNVLFLNDYFKILMPYRDRLLVISLSLIIWVVIIILWERRNSMSEKQ